jgi:hypothetical protein
MCLLQQPLCRKQKDGISEIVAMDAADCFEIRVSGCNPTCNMSGGGIFMYIVVKPEIFSQEMLLDAFKIMY